MSTEINNDTTLAETEISDNIPKQIEPIIAYNDSVNSKYELLKRKRVEANRKWYNSKGKEIMKANYSHQPAVIDKIINRIKDDDVILKVLVQQVGLVKLVSLTAQK
jgi:hypothetical protein